MSGYLDGGEDGRGILEELELESEVTVTKDSKPLSSSFELAEYEEGRKYDGDPALQSLSQRSNILGVSPARDDLGEEFTYPYLWPAIKYFS